MSALPGRWAHADLMVHDALPAKLHHRQTGGYHSAEATA